MSPASTSPRKPSSTTAARNKSGDARATAPVRPAGARSGAGIELTALDMARELAAVVEAHSLAEIIIETQSMTLTVRRSAAAPGGHAAQSGQPVYPAPAMSHATLPPPFAGAPGTIPPPIAGLAVDDNFHLVTSPFVGTYYKSPGPDAAPYVAEGQKVDKGQVLCIVEAMKLMNEIEADVAGTVVQIMVENGKTVEYGQPLFKISRS